MVRPLPFLLLCNLAFGPGGACCADAGPGPGYDAELAQGQATIRVLTEQTRHIPVPPLARLRLAHQLYGTASLTASYRDFHAAEAAIDAALKAGEASAECWYLKASFDLKLHRIRAARQSLTHLAHLIKVPQIEALQADILLQEGHVARAAVIFERLAADGGSWDNLARAAWVRSRQGKPSEADRLYAVAQEELTAKEMRSWAWLELQRGLLDLDAGRFAEALARYQRADRAYPGYWLIHEHIAEVFGKLGRTEEAIALYRRIIARTQHPEFVSALAVIEQRTAPAPAALLFAEARRLFEAQRTLYPEAAGGHFLEHLIDLPGAPDPELLSLADENLRLRPTPDAMILKARVCLKLNDAAAARHLVSVAQKAGWQTSEMDELIRRLP